jgi:hypothetical protein
MPQRVTLQRPSLDPVPRACAGMGSHRPDSFTLIVDLRQLATIPTPRRHAQWPRPTDGLALGATVLLYLAFPRNSAKPA